MVSNARACIAALAGLIPEPSFHFGEDAPISTSPAGIFAFPDNTADAILHLTTGALFAVVATIQLGLDRQA